METEMLKVLLIIPLVMELLYYQKAKPKNLLEAYYVFYLYCKDKYIISVLSKFRYLILVFLIFIEIQEIYILFLFLYLLDTRKIELSNIKKELSYAEFSNKELFKKSSNREELIKVLSKEDSFLIVYAKDMLFVFNLILVLVIVI